MLCPQDETLGWVEAALQIVGQIGATNAQSTTYIMQNQMAATTAAQQAGAINTGAGVNGFLLAQQAQSKALGYGVIAPSQTDLALQQIAAQQSQIQSQIAQKAISKASEQQSSDQTKKIIIWSSVGVAVLGGIVGAVLYFKK